MLAALLVEVVDHHEVEVRAGGEIARPEPPEPEDRGAAHGAAPWLGHEVAWRTASREARITARAMAE